MDDDKKKPGRGGKPGGFGKGPGKGPGGPRRDGPRKAAGPRPERPGEDRPKRDFKRDDRPRGNGEKKPFRKDDGERRPFRPREERAGEARAERPKRDFNRDDRPRGDGEKKPFRKDDGERRPFRPREERAGEARAERPKRDFSRDDRPRGNGEKKPFRKDGGGDRPYRRKEAGGFDARAPKPGRREREAAGNEDGAVGGDERIARRLARAGVASRRDAEDMIAAGRITLNGKVLDSPAVNVGPKDQILIDGKPIPATERTRLFLFHKPAGVVTTNRDPEGRQTVFDVLPRGLPRLVTVGRLDINTEGLLLLTNDGGLSRLLELPATGWLRRYRVRVHGKVDPEALEGLKDGIAVDGVFYGGVEATLDREQGSNAWLTIGLREGKNREVRNILGALGLDVTRLIRVSYGPFQLGELAEGEVRELKGKLLREQLGERLIAESGANFDAPIVTEFSNKPVKAEPVRDTEARPARRMDRDEKREAALGRLDTRAPRPRQDKGGKPDKGFKGGKPGKPGFGGKDDRRDDKPAAPAGARKANVWMAPGARPMGEKKAAAFAARTEGRRYAGKPKPADRGGGGAGGDRPGGGRPPRKPRRED